MRKWLGFRLRRLADRIDWVGAPKFTGLSFTIEDGVGLVINEDGRGCPLAYLGNEEYDRAHDESGQTPKQFKSPKLYYTTRQPTSS